MSGSKVAHVCAVAVAVAVLSQSAQAAVYGFQGITLNNGTNVAIGSSQLQMHVTAAGPGQVLFAFHNVGAGQSVIEQVFLEKGPLGGLASIANSAGVSFSADLPNPGNLPGGNSLSPPFVEAFSASADNPAPSKGVNNSVTDSELVSLLFNLASGQTFGDVLADLGGGTLRVGVHVIAYSNGGSESFVATPVPIVVPEPATGLLVLAGTMAGGAVRRRLRA